MTSFQGKTVVVTGATSGIGKELVFKLLALGANVAFCGRSEAKMHEVLGQLDYSEDRYFSRVFDLVDYAEIPKFVTSCLERFGNIDVLINCAGANTARGTMGEIQLEDLEFMLKLNALAPFVFMQSVYNQAMHKQGAGTIINVLSTVCNYSNQGIASYTASKSTLDSLAKVFRKEVREHGVKICSIYPGGVDTPFREADRPEYLSASDVVESIVYMLEQKGGAVVDELVIRPMVETNFS